MHGDTAEHRQSMGQLWGRVEEQSRPHACPWSLPGACMTPVLLLGCGLGCLEAAPGQDSACLRPLVLGRHGCRHLLAEATRHGRGERGGQMCQGQLNSRFLVPSAQGTCARPQDHPALLGWVLGQQLLPGASFPVSHCGVSWGSM